MSVRGFFGEYRFLSNFYPSPMTIDGKFYPTAEHYYQASKADNEEDHELIRKCSSPAEAKRLGRKIKMRAGFNKGRVHVMEIALEHKYRQNPELMQLLLDTQFDHIEETNTWGDQYWGVCNGEGHNRLGYILMNLRDTFKHERFWEDHSV